MYQTKNKINVLIVDDHHLIIEGLVSLLTEEPGINIVDGVHSGAAALDAVARQPIDVVLADINMPRMSGIEFTRRVKQCHPGTEVIALTMHNDNTLITQMVEAGAAGYLLKSTNISELCDAIYAVARGEKFLSPEVQSVIMRNISHNKSATAQVQPNATRLSPREAEILNLIAQELTNEEIGKKLFIGKRTVETHRRNIFAKTKTKTVVGLIQYALDNNLISPREKKAVD
jgi:DNA-binding NarL/FixJ family response regulator